MEFSNVQVEHSHILGVAGFGLGGGAVLVGTRFGGDGRSAVSQSSHCFAVAGLSNVQLGHGISSEFRELDAPAVDAVAGRLRLERSIQGM